MTYQYLPTAYQFVNHTGKRYGRLLVLSCSHKYNGQYRWHCRCDCGNEKTLSSQSLSRGTKSCGCLQKEVASRDAIARFTTHGNSTSRTPEYKAWQNMLNRCSNPQEHRYAGRGIEVCDAWRDSFAEFLKDMGKKPTPRHSLDRIDNDGHYEPGNCRWATPREQSLNTCRNVMVTFDGKTMTLYELAQKLDVKYTTLHSAIRRRNVSRE